MALAKPRIPPYTALMRTAVLAALALLAWMPARAALPETKLDGVLNGWLLEGLKTARAEWRDDACLGSIEIRGLATAEPVYKFWFHSPATKGAAFHYENPHMVKRAGEMEYYQVFDKGPGEEDNAARCIDAMPINYDRAFKLAVKGGFDPAKNYEARRDYFPEEGNGLRINGFVTYPMGKLVPKGHELWFFVSGDPNTAIYDKDHVVSYVAVDAFTGRILKSYRRIR